MTDESPFSEHATMFHNRLKKVARHRRKWARKRSIYAYRLYDRDISEIPLVVDWYDGRLYIAEFVRHSGAQPGGWREAMAVAAAEALEIVPERVYFKQRERQRGASQYEKLESDDPSARFEVEEGGLRFWVNLGDYLDTGLFLDHRDTRARVRDEASGRDVLNLFAYTGTFSVYAAAGGAASTTTMDMSRTYLEWADANLASNGFVDRDIHQTVRQDCCAWLRTEEGKWEYDLAIVDPPSFSNSRSMAGTFDVQRDQVWMLRRVLSKMRFDGVIYFSTNRRGFKPEFEGGVLGDYVEIEELSEALRPDDYKKATLRTFRMTKTKGRA